MSVAADVSDWIRTPAPLNYNKRGKRAVFSSDNSIVQRRYPEKWAEDCVCYTDHALPPGQVWTTTVLETSTTRWGTGLRVGVTATLPDEVPIFLLSEESGSMEWNYVNLSVYHNRIKLYSDLPYLRDLKPHQRVGLLLTTSGDLHVFLDGRHIKKVAAGLPVSNHMWGVVDVYGRCTKIKSELLSDPAMHLKEALKDGYIPHKDDLFLIHGPGGVGKSSLIAMFLGKQRDLARVSTAVAEESLHVCPVRNVSTSMFTDQWEHVDINRQARMVAHTSRHLFTSASVKRVELPTKEVFEMHENCDETTESTPFLAQVEPPAPQIPARDDNKPYFFPPTPSLLPTPPQNTQKSSTKTRFFLFKLRKWFLKKRIEALEPADTLTTSLGENAKKIEAILDRIQEDLHEFMRESSDTTELFLYYSIRVVDSGGQPQFHEVVSIILQAVTGIVAVFKLSEPLDVHGEVVFYKDGEQANDPYRSYLTNEQVIRHDLLAIQSEASCSGLKEMPSLAFVGTHLDQKDACPEETPDQKDKKLHSMITDILPEELQECIISNGKSLTQVTFRVNTRTPTENDYKTTGQLKEALMSLSKVKPKNLPLKWCTYEVALRKLMASLQRQVLSLQDCEFLGYKLGFDPPSLQACLYYLRKFHIISFYNVLPNIIFASCQVILDKITELVTYSLELKKGNRALTGAERKFYQQGILSQKILESNACSKHYKPILFTIYNLLAILRSLLIITEVRPGEYLMPCVLEVSDIFPSAPLAKDYTQTSFVLHFSKKSPMLGIYCCTISYLLTKAGWKLLSKGGDVVQVARNSMTFKLPRNLPGKLTFLDPLSSYLEVLVELPATIATNHCNVLYPEIRNTFFLAIKEAMQTLHYEVKTPELAFLCPESKAKTSPRCSALPHLASVDKSMNILTCSKNPESVFYLLSSDQKIWLTKGSRPEGSAEASPTTYSSFSGSEGRRGMSNKRANAASPLSITSKQPTMQQLLRLNLPSRVGPKVNAFGTFLLQDDLGDKMSNIRGNHQGRPEEMAMEVLTEWLAGKGVEVSWKSLIATLRDCELSLMATQIQMALDQLRS